MRLTMVIRRGDKYLRGTWDTERPMVLTHEGHEIALTGRERRIALVLRDQEKSCKHDDPDCLLDRRQARQ